MTTINDIRMEHLTTDTAVSPTAISAKFVGSAEADAKPLLDAYWRGVNEVALKSAVKEVALDFRDLHFMNSSCLNAFVTWIGAVQDVAPEQQYHFRFISNPKHMWQERSLAALTCFAVDLITVEAVSG
jgi:hypothetical protein